MADKDGDDDAKATGGKRSSGEMLSGGSNHGRKPPKTATPLDAVSAALRQAYESTVDEAIPELFMDLLNKLD